MKDKRDNSFKPHKGYFRKRLAYLKQLATVGEAIEPQDVLEELDIVFAGYLQSEIHDITNRDKRAEAFMTYSGIRDAMRALLVPTT